MKIWFQGIMRYYLIQSVKLYGLKYPLVKITFTVGGCYRSPSSTTEENMQLTKVIETAANNFALILGILIILVLTGRIWMPITVADIS